MDPSDPTPRDPRLILLAALIALLAGAGAVVAAALFVSQVLV